MMQSRSLASVPQHSPASHCSSGTLLGTSVAHRSQRSVRQVIRCYEFKGLAISRADARKVYESLHFVFECGWCELTHADCPDRMEPGLN